MSNKKLFKELYSKHWNKEKNYQKILQNIERDKKNRNKYLKWSFVPVCLVVFICGFMIFGGNRDSILSPDENSNQPYANKNNNVVLNINHVKKENELAKIDGFLKEISMGDVPYSEVLANLEIPNDFNNKAHIYALYVKSDRNEAEYDYLMQYENIYTSSNRNRNISIQYSHKNKPVRDYRFEEGKTSNINNLELTIYQYEESYMIELYYKGLYMDIETSNITEQELITLLQSIIK